MGYECPRSYLKNIYKKFQQPLGDRTTNTSCVELFCNGLSSYRKSTIPGLELSGKIGPHSTSKNGNDMSHIVRDYYNAHAEDEPIGLDMPLCRIEFASTLRFIEKYFPRQITGDARDMNRFCRR
jgi:hypothetical protein